MANWSDLHSDLLSVIAKRVRCIEDYIAFGCVCKSWRMATPKHDFNDQLMTRMTLPWLMLANDDEESSVREFYSVSTKRSFKITLPESNGKRIFSSQGWLLTVGKDLEVNLLHPLSRSQIRLPNFTKFPIIDYEGIRDMQTSFIHKVVLSSTPSTTSSSSSDNVVVMISFGSYGKLAFCKAGDEAWTIIDTYFSWYFDVIFHKGKGKFYAVDCRARVFVIDHVMMNPTTTTTTTAKLVSVLPDGYIDLKEKFYLVESSSSGKLLLISREGVEVVYVDESETELTYGTNTFHVFELNEGNGEWKKVQSLGRNEAIFLGDNSSFFIDISSVGYNNCMPNCIYFTDDSCESYHPQQLPIGGGKDMGVYHLIDGSIEPHFKGESYSRLAPPLWIVPSF